MKNPLLEYKYCPSCSKTLAVEMIENGRGKKCTNCDFIIWSNPKPVVSMLLAKDEKVLMLRRAHDPLKDYWVLPGGFVDYEESPELAVVREVTEEVGVTPSIKKLIGVYHIDNDPRGMHIDIIYYGEIKGEIGISSEHSEFKFFSINELPKQIAFKHSEAIMDWVK